MQGGNATCISAMQCINTQDDLEHLCNNEERVIDQIRFTDTYIKGSVYKDYSKTCTTYNIYPAPCDPCCNC